MSLGLPEEKRSEAEELIEDVAEQARRALAEHEDWDFFHRSRNYAAGIARGVLALGYRQDYEELKRKVDELFRCPNQGLDREEESGG